MDKFDLFWTCYFIVNTAGAIYKMVEGISETRNNRKPSGVSDEQWESWQSQPQWVKNVATVCAFVVNVGFFLPWVLIAEPLLSRCKQK